MKHRMAPFLEQRRIMSISDNNLHQPVRTIEASVNAYSGISVWARARNLESHASSIVWPFLCSTSFSLRLLQK